MKRPETVQTEKHEKPKMKKTAVLSRLLPYLMRYKFLMLGAILLTVGGNLLSLAGPYISGLAVDAMELGCGKVNFEKVGRYGVLMVVMYAISAALSYALTRLMIVISRRVVNTMRHDVFQKLSELPVGYFDTHQTGDILSRISYDIDTINTELILADLQTIENALPKLEKDLRGKKIEPAYMEAVKQAKTILEAGETIDKATREGRFDKDSVYDLHLMSAKPFIYVFNVDDAELQNKDMQAKLAASVAPAPAIFLNAQFEADLTELDEADAREMLADAGLEESGLDQLARVGYDTLGLSTFLTAGEKEVRAWQIHKGYTAPQAAGVIHTDFEKGFIKADIVSYDDFVAAEGSMVKIKEEGKLRQEGRDYVMQDGDIVEFKFNVSKK